MAAQLSALFGTGPSRNACLITVCRPRSRQRTVLLRGRCAPRLDRPRTEPVPRPGNHAEAVAGRWRRGALPAAARAGPAPAARAARQLYLPGQARRGSGFELRTDARGTLRGGDGVLMSTTARGDTARTDLTGSLEAQQARRARVNFLLFSITYCPFSTHQTDRLLPRPEQILH